MARKHGACVRHPKLYSVWKAMVCRCENPNMANFKDYGQRGINVCDEWHDPNVFISWALAHGYEEGLQLDRIDNDGGYSPENCRWATPKENSRHTRKTKTLTLIGQTKSVAEWCEALEISEYTIYYWLREHGEKGCEKRVYQRLADAS